MKSLALNRKLILGLGLLVLALFVAQALASFNKTVQRSIEVGVTATSPLGFNGGVVIPASCPSFDHGTGGTCVACDGSWVDVITYDGNGNASVVQQCDSCPNFDGNQTTIPAGYVKDSAGNCVIPDSCPNIPLVQTSVPIGYQLDSSGNCVVIPVGTSLFDLRVNGSKNPPPVASGEIFYFTWSSQDVQNCTPEMVSSSDSWWTNGAGVSVGGYLPTSRGNAATYTSTGLQHSLIAGGTYTYLAHCESTVASAAHSWFERLTQIPTALAATLYSSVPVTVTVCNPGETVVGGVCVAADLCPNIPGNQTSIPPGDIIDGFGNCVVAPACTPNASEQRTLACPVGKTGNIVEQRDSTCPGPTWGAWHVTLNSCVTITSCTPDVQTQSLMCPTGQSGDITRQRVRSCPAGTWSSWIETSNTCHSGCPLSTLTLASSKLRIRSGDNVRISWNASDVQSCTVTGPSSFSGSGATGFQDTAALTARSVFTLTCIPLSCALGGGTPVSTTVTVNIIPFGTEI